MRMFVHIEAWQWAPPLVQVAFWIVLVLVVSAVVAGAVARVIHLRDRQPPDEVDTAYEEAVEASKVRAKQLFLERPRTPQQEREAHERYEAFDWRGEA